MDQSINEELSLDVTPMSIIDPNDPNFDPDWDYANPSTTTAEIFYGQRVNGQLAPSTEVLLPWFSAGNPINNEDKDYLPELGWALYLKDFGTPERPAQTPFFVLYNKYSGVLRFFVYNYRVRNLGEQSKTYYVAELGFNNVSNYNSSLSFYASEEEFTKENINPNLRQVVVTKKNVSDTWLNFDFVMMHDTDYKELLLNVYGANQTDLDLGSDFSTLTAISSVGASSTSLTGFGTAMEKGYEYTSTTKSLLDAVDKLREKLGPNGDSQANTAKLNNPSSSVPVVNANEPNTVVQPFVIGTITAALAVVQGAIGVAKSFIGGKNTTKNTQTSIQFDGIVNTTGTSTLSNNLYSIQFHQDPQAMLTANRYVPVFQGQVGVMAALSQAKLFIYRYFYNNCEGLESAPSRARLNWVNYRLKINGTYDYFIINEVDGVKVDSVTFSLVSQRFIDETKEDFLHGIGNYPPLGWRSAWFYEECMRRSGNPEPWITVQTPWKALTVPIPPYEDDTKTYELANIYYPSDGTVGTGRMDEPSYTATSFPYIAVGLHYRITDPNYPNNDGRDRVVYKIFKPVEVSLDGREYDSGCPYWYYDFVNR